MSKRKSNSFFIFLAANIILLLLMYTHASFMESKESNIFRENAELVKQYTLTDLCLFTEATYTRHLSQADLHSPFQDSPMALEHFPTGSIVLPPQTIRKFNVRVD